MEFYFTEYNLECNNIVKAEAKGHDGYIDLATFLGFKHMEAFEAFPGLVEEALDESKRFQFHHKVRKVKFMQRIWSERFKIKFRK